MENNITNNRYPPATQEAFKKNIYEYFDPNPSGKKEIAVSIIDNFLKKQGSRQL